MMHTYRTEMGRAGLRLAPEVIVRHPGAHSGFTNHEPSGTGRRDG
jgi:hypothetical protein